MGKFHLHVDAFSMSEDFGRFLEEELGFWRSDFAGHPGGVPHFEPAHHLTQKTNSVEEFKSLFDQVVAYASSRSAIHGYVEGEFVTFELDIQPRPFDASVSLPFTFSTVTLPPEQFRETEIHITMDRDRSDPRLLRSLENMGFFAAYLPKPYGTAQVLTVQGSRGNITALLEPLVQYLETAGGAVNCSVKEERIAKWWKSSPEAPVPPVVENINWSN